MGWQAQVVTGVVNVLRNDFSATPIGAASIPAALSDNSDSTYVWADNTLGGELIMALPPPSLPANAILTGISFELRRQVTLGSDQDNPFWVYRVLGSELGTGRLVGTTIDGSFTARMAWNTSVQDSSTGYVVQFSDGTHVKDMDPAGWIVSLGYMPTPTGAHDIYLFRFRTTWWYNQKPTVTLGTNPTTTTTTSRPNVDWTYSDPEGDPQRSWRVIVVPDGAASSLWPYGFAGDSGFNPEGASAVAWDSGMRYEPYSSIQVPVGLENGRSYWAYVKAYTDPISGTESASPWTGRKFTVNVTPPAAPLLTVTPDPVNARNRVLTAESTTAIPHPTTFDTQRSDDGGATWDYVRGGQYASKSAGFYTPGTGTAGWDTPDRTQFTFGNGIRVQWAGRLTDYTPAVDTVLLGQSRSASRGWKLIVRTDGRLELQWSTTGASWDKVATSTVAPSVLNGAELWIEAKAILNTNPWTVVFRASANGSTWSLVGNTVTGTGPATMNNSTSPIEVAGADSHTANRLAGTTNLVNVWNSSGVLVAAPSWIGFTNANLTSFSDTTGGAWTHVGSGDYIRMGLDLYDYEAPVGVPVLYRTRAYRSDSAGDAVGSWVTTPGTTTLTTSVWWFKDPLDPTANMPVAVVEWRRTKPKLMTVTDGIDATTAIVVHGGTRSERIDARLRTLDQAAYDSLLDLLTSGRTLLVSGIFGEQWYVQGGDITLDVIRAAPLPTETSPLRHAHEIGVQLIEVEKP